MRLAFIRRLVVINLDLTVRMGLVSIRSFVVIRLNNIYHLETLGQKCSLVRRPARTMETKNTPVVGSVFVGSDGFALAL
jgi:hypothetical protein